MEKYDFVVIGAGCAGASGAMYASRLNLKTLMIGELPGGLITTTHLVENWPGIKAISGPDLGFNLVDHATSFGVPLANERVQTVEMLPISEEDKAAGKKAGFLIKTGSNEYLAKTVLFATGSTHKKLYCPGEKELENKGVSYCALCDGAFYKNKIVSVVGSGDSAAKEALLLAEHAAKVYVFSRSTLHPEPVNLERVKANPKIERLDKTEVAEIMGEGKVQKVRLKDGRELEMDAVFIAIGLLPHSDLAEKLGVKLNDKKEIEINRNSETNIPGIFGAGDVTDAYFKQAITGSAEA
ncbi:FAD-dependent oxidoreductase, partial [Candidatus Peregrinibacteria bacterium]|nr:FAD-dependent oxidoreductase [Candidatus Peregrinibacteria bacterium]